VKQPSRAVFLSHASEDAEAAQRICSALRAAEIEVWFDQSELRGGDAWDASIRKQIRECALFMPLISTHTEARGEGYFRLEWKLAIERSRLLADDQAFLLPVTLDGTLQATARVPDLFRERQWMCIKSDPDVAALVSRLRRLLSDGQAADTPEPATAAAPALTTPLRRAAPHNDRANRVTVCVLPFANMSGDPEQEYFSDGVSEDIITDLSKVSALWIAARNTAFTFKGRRVDVIQVARQLDVSYVLEGSVRRAGRRVRITAQLIDGATGGHLWAERYDRDLDDIFALQDEIAAAIVAALKLQLLPEEKKAIGQRGTSNADAYKLYLMARQYRVRGNMGSARCQECIIRLCTRATEIDPQYARPWALLALAQGHLRLMVGREGDGGLAAAERALALDRNLGDAHAAKAHVLTAENRLDEARPEIDTALALEPDAFEANYVAARWYYASRRFAEAIPCFEKAADIEDTHIQSLGLLNSCLKACGHNDRVWQVAERLLARSEKVAMQEPDNGSAMSGVVSALAALGDAERVKEWIERGVLLDPDNLHMRYNFACIYATELHDLDAALDLLEPITQKVLADSINWMRIDPDFDPLRDHPRFIAMLAAAELRLSAAGSPMQPPVPASRGVG
jgi:adenylate cyclase